MSTVKLQISKLFYPTYKIIKQILSNFITKKYSKRDWKAIEIYINSKDKENKLFQDFVSTNIKKIPSVAGFSRQLKSSIRNKSASSVRHLKTIAYTNDTAFITCTAN